MIGWFHGWRLWSNRQYSIPRVCLMRLFLIILFLLSSASVSFAETIILGAENDWVPYSNHDGTGMANEIVLAAYKAVGIDVKFQVGPYNRLLKMVRNGEILGAFNVPQERSNEKEYRSEEHTSELQSH